MRKSRGGFNFELRQQGADFGDARGPQSIAQRGNDPDFLYYNAQIINNSTATTQKYDDPDITYQDTRSVPILEDKSKYGISVENFIINGAGKNLPIFIPQIREYNIDGSLNRNPNNTVYDIIFTAQYGGTKTTPELVYQSTRSIQWEPELKASWTDTPVPLGTYKYPQPEIPYYYCYTYSHWLKLVNSALALAWADVKAAALAGGVPGLTIVINSLNGTFTKGGLVQNLETGGTAFVVNFSGLTNTLILYNITGDFRPGDTIFQEPDVGTARITTVSTAVSVNVPAVELGTKCPFYTYDPKTNLFSLHQDANTCLTPFGSAVTQGPFNSTNPPNALNVFGSSTASGYVSGEYSFVGYNTNFEALFTNFDTTYYSDQIPYPSIGSLGISITSPLGTESVEQSTAVEVDEGQIVGFVGDQMAISWLGSPGNVAGSNWKFGMPQLIVSSSAGTPSVGGSYTITGSLYASYLKVGVLVELTKTSVPNVKIVGQITSVVGDKPITSLVLKVKSLTDGASSTSWSLATLTMNSDTDALPIAGKPLSLVTDLGPGESVIQVNHAVNVSGPGGQSFDGLVSSFQETLNYTNPSGGGNEFLIYKDATLPDGFNPIASYVAQNGKFEIGDIVKGTTSAATAQVVDILAENSGDPNVVTILNQTGSFQVGDNVTAGSGSAIITKIEGPNSANSIVRNGILSVGPTYLDAGKYYYSGPFNEGDTIQVGSTRAVITEVNGENGYTTISYSSQKNPFAVGQEIECYASLADLSPEKLITKGKIVSIEGENLGYGKMIFTNQNGKFGVGESVVDSTQNPPAVATIVAVEGENNGYAYINYINQLLTGALGNFIPGEFLLLDGVAFAQVVIDKQNVANQTEGNIGVVTCTLGEEIAGVFYGNSSVPLPFTGQQIQGSSSGTVADFGGVAFLDSGALIVNNICGTFYTGDVIYDNVGFGLPTTKANVTSTAVCNGVSYLGNGKLVVKNTSGGTVKPPVFATDTFIYDYDSIAHGTATNPLVLDVDDIQNGRQFYQGSSVSSTVGGVTATGTVIANNGPYPYGSPVTSRQLLTILPADGSPAFQQGPSVLLESNEVGTYLSIALGSQTGVFYPGDQITQGAVNGTLNKVLPYFPAFPNDFGVADVTGTFTTGIVYNSNQLIYCNGVYLWWNGSNIFGQVTIDQEIPQAGQQCIDFDQDIDLVCSYSSGRFQFQFNNPAFSVGDVVQGSKSQVTGKVSFTFPGANPPQLQVVCTNGRFVNGEQLLNLSFPAKNNSSTVGSINYQIGNPTNDSIIQFNKISSPPFTMGLTDTIGVLPYKIRGNPGVSTTNVQCAGAKITLATNNSLFTVGDPFYVFNGENHWASYGIVTSQDGLDLIISWKSFTNKALTGTHGFSDGNWCAKIPYTTSSIDTIATIDYYANGFFNCLLGDMTQTSNTSTFSQLPATTTTASGVVTITFTTIPNTTGLPIGKGFIGNTSTAKATVTAVSTNKLVYTCKVVSGTFDASEDVKWIEQLTLNFSAAGTGQTTNGLTSGRLVTNINNATANATILSGSGLTWVCNNVIGFFGQTDHVQWIYSNYVNNAFNAAATVTSVSGALITSGYINDLITSASNAFVQSTQYPQDITSLKLTNLTGNIPITTPATNFTDLQTLNKGSISNFAETTDYSGTLTTLNVRNVVNIGQFTASATITDVQAAKTATIGSVAFQNGSLMLKATNNIQFQAGEFITDLGTTATATLTSTPQSQSIVGLTSGTTAVVLLDKNSQLKLASIVGTGFDTTPTGEQIQSTAGTLATIEDTSYFGIGNLVTTPTGQGTIVSDSGEELVISNVSGIFTPSQTLTSVYEGVTTTATLQSLDNPIMIIIPTNSTGQSGSWTVVPQTLTSSTTVQPSAGADIFTTNLTIDETIFDTTDSLHVTETIPTLTLEQLYYPENVVQVDLSAGNAVIETLQSAFPSSASGSQYIVLTQDYESTSSLWSPIASIVIGTQFLTVREEYSGTPITIGTGNLGGNATTGSFQKVLLETPIEVLPQESWRGLISYFPKIETTSSLGLSKDDLKNLDVQVYWRNRLTNSLIPLTLYNSGSANIRLLFKRIRE